ncbi:MAG: PH domain-containing protein [Acidobacteriaceae bacterium]
MTWNALSWVAPKLLWIAPLLAFLVLIAGVGKPKSAGDLADGKIEFAPSRIELAAWVVIFICLMIETIDLFRHSQGQILNLLSAACPGLLVLVVISYVPGTIVITADGLQQIYWFSRNKRIRWEEIVEINTGKKNRDVTITGANRTKIIHSNQLPDRARLLLELKRHCGENLPPDFPRESQSH